MILQKCKRCNHEWIPRIINTATCPRCKSYYWDKAKKSDKKLEEEFEEEEDKPSRLSFKKWITRSPEIKQTN